MNIIDFFGKPLNPMETEDEPDYNKNIDSLIQENLDTSRGLLGGPLMEVESDFMTPSYMKQYAKGGPYYQAPSPLRRQFDSQDLSYLGGEKRPGIRGAIDSIGSLVRAWWNNRGKEPDYLGNAPMDKVRQQLGEPEIY